MNVYWVCDCSNVNKFEYNQLLVFTSENKEQFIKDDICVKCGKKHDFRLELKITEE